jgi:hypothetical protein
MIGAADARECALRLALGRPLRLSLDEPAWHRVLLAATEERCGPLAWLRSSATIRADAPHAIAEQWRASSLGTAARTSADLAALHELYERLDGNGLSPIVLKGAPLAVRLYGDPSARPCSDIDIFVNAADRRRARTELAALGWKHLDGDVPWDESFVRGEGRRARLLEVHSTLLHARLGYLYLPVPDAEMVRVDDVTLRAHGGPLLPGYLAVHLSTHQFAPMLWWLDLATLWNAMDDGARAQATRTAERAGVGRYLRWAMRRIDALDRLADGDHSKVRLLGLEAGARSAAHPMWRHLRLAPSMSARRAALADWLWPPWMRESYGASPLGFARRAIRHAGDVLPRRRQHPELGNARGRG